MVSSENGATLHIEETRQLDVILLRNRAYGGSEFTSTRGQRDV